MTFNASEMTHHEEEGCGLRPFPDDPSQAWKWGAQPASETSWTTARLMSQRKSAGFIFCIIYLM